MDPDVEKAQDLLVDALHQLRTPSVDDRAIAILDCMLAAVVLACGPRGERAAVRAHELAKRILEK